MAGTAVIDSNVLVAGLLTGTPDAPTARIVEGMLCARFPFALSMELLAEYHRVLRYPKVSRLHRLEDNAIDDLLAELTIPAMMIEPAELHVDLPDPDDVFLFRLLRAIPRGVLVTGDHALLESCPDRAQVVTPHQFISAAP